MGIPSENSAQIKIGKLILDNLQEGKDKRLTTNLLIVELNKDNLNLSAYNVQALIKRHYLGIISYSKDEHVWGLSKGITTNDLSDHLEIIERDCRRKIERL